MSPNSTHGRGTLALLALLALLIATTPISLLALTEVALRFAYPEKAVLPTGREVLEGDSARIYRLRPNVKASFIRVASNGGQTIFWSTNADGYHGKPLRKKPGRRVVVFGDSNIQGVFSELDNTFASRLEKYLDQTTGSDVEVVNAGVMGYGPDQALLRLTHDVKTLKPDVAVFHVFADNDYGDLLRNRLFRVSDGVLTRDPNPSKFQDRTRSERMQDFVASLLVIRVARKLFGLTSSNSSSGPPTQPPPRDPDQYAAKLLAAGDDELRWYSGTGSDTAQSDHFDLDVALYPERPSARAKIELMAAVLGAARDVAARAGVKFLVVIEPSAVDLTTNLTLNYRFLAKFPEYRPERMTQLIQAMCDERRIANVNLFSVFKATDPDHLYFRDTDNHWNDAGEDLAAREVAKSIAPLLMSERGAGLR